MKLQSILFSGLLVLGTISTAHAKDGEGGFGIKGGIGFSTISFGDPKNTSDFQFKDKNNSWKVGGLVGISYEARIGNVFALDIEADLANKGVKRENKYSILGKDGKLTMKGNLFTLDIPITAKFYLGDHFNLNVGPYFSYIMGGKAKVTNVFDGKTEAKESNNWYGEDYKDNNGELPMNRFDFGANLGLEFVTNSGFGIGARFQKGFLNLANKKYNGAFTDNDGLILPANDKFVTNTGVQLYASFRF